MSISQLSLFATAAAIFGSGLWLSVDAICECTEPPIGVVTVPAEGIDAGTFPVGAPAMVRIKIQNNTCGRIRLLRLNTGCSCTTGSMSTEQLERGEQAVITLQLNARQHAGPFGLGASLEYQLSEDSTPHHLILSATGSFVLPH
ncbi:MAG: DUF1573 domain-containing protein [Planctomycetaceae bacterium]